jgi:hypothetical protein
LRKEEHNMDIGDSIRDLFDKDDKPQEAAELEDEAYSLEAVDYGPDEVEEEEYAPEEGSLLDKVDFSRGGLENLMGKIPGYRGYKEKEMRREADKLLRMQVAGQLDDQRKRLSELQMQLVSQVQIEHVDDMERAIMKLQLLIDRVKTASYGYAGLFDAIRVEEEQLDALYDFDTQLLILVQEIATDVDQVASAIGTKEGVGLAIAELIVTVEEANVTFGHRDEAISQAE